MSSDVLVNSVWITQHQSQRSFKHELSWQFLMFMTCCPAAACNCKAWKKFILNNANSKNGRKRITLEGYSQMFKNLKKLMVQSSTQMKTKF